MIGVETCEGLFEAAIRVVDRKLACVIVRGKHNLQPNGLGHCGYDLHRASMSHIREIKKEELTKTNECEPCAKGKTTRMLKRSLEG